MNLIARSSEKAPAALSSAASESPRKTRHESQNPLSPQVEKYDGTERPFDCPQKGARERNNPLYAHTHQATQNGMLIKLGLLKSGNLMN